MIDKAFLDSLTDAEILVFQYIVRRWRYRDIAEKLQISHKTVAGHVNKMCLKAGIEFGKKTNLIRAWDAARRKEFRKLV